MTSRSSVAQLERPELEKRVEVLERRMSAPDLSALPIDFIVTKLGEIDERGARVERLVFDLRAAFNKREEADAERAAAATAKDARQSQTDLAQEARIARLETAGRSVATAAPKIGEAASSLHDALPKIDVATDRLVAVADSIPAKGSPLRSWITFGLVLLMAIAEIARLVR